MNNIWENNDFVWQFSGRKFWTVHWNEIHMVQDIVQYPKFSELEAGKPVRGYPVTSREVRGIY